MQAGKDYIGVGCGAFILNEKEEVLLQQRNKAPERGYWSIPGGKVEMFETLEQAIKREVEEETGTKIDIIELLGACNHIVLSEKVHWVSPAFLCKIVNGEPKIMEPEKHIDMKWFPLEQLPENITITTQNALKCYKKYKTKKGE